ncbi:MAG: TonB-dependent receptor plug domain-containing protein [Gammaproteobacteria bacterium]
MRTEYNHWLTPSLLFFALTAPVRAEQSVDDLMALSPAELAKVSVSIASGTATELSHSAAVTTVITAEQISAMGATELHEVLETVPGLHKTIQPVTNDYNYSMRGIRNGTNAEILLLMNGTRYSVPYQGTHLGGMIIPVANIQRIEVIRGPGSALYGADAFAGVINIVTKKAADIDGVTLGARGGNADMKSTWGQYGGHWQGWDVATSLQYSHNGIDPDRIISSDAQSLFDAALGTRASLAPGPMQTQNERWNGHLNLQRKHWDLGFWAFNEVNLGMRAGTTGALDDRGRFNGSNYLADIRYSTEDDIEDWELQAHASFLHTDLVANIYNFPAGALLPIDSNGNVTGEFASARGLVSFPDGLRLNVGLKNTMPSFEFTSIYKGFSGHLLRLALGFRYEELNTREARNYGVGILDVANLPPVAGELQDVTQTPATFIGDHHRDIWSVAAQDEWQISPNWHLTTGLRYDHYSDFGSTLNPRAALVWDVTTTLTAKLLYGQAYRAPAFVEQYQKNNPIFVGNPSLQPETISTTEIAFDYRATDNLRTTLNLYHYEMHHSIGGETSHLNSIPTERNLPGQDGYGSEFEWDWRFHPDWNLRGNYSWQFARNEATHIRVPTVPEHHVYSALAWNFMPKWRIQTQINWIGHRLSSPTDNRVLRDYETVDITLNAKRLMGYLDLTASARNLFDSHGKEEGIATYPDNLPIPGQSFYFEASIHF